MRLTYFKKGVKNTVNLTLKNALKKTKLKLIQDMKAHLNGLVLMDLLLGVIWVKFNIQLKVEIVLCQSESVE